MFNDCLFLAPKLFGYPLVLIGSIVVLGMFYRLLRFNKLGVNALAKPCNASTLLGLAAVVFYYLLARHWTATWDSTLDILSWLAYVASLGFGIKTVFYDYWKEISEWVGKQTWLGGCGG